MTQNFWKIFYHFLMMYLFTSKFSCKLFIWSRWFCFSLWMILNESEFKCASFEKENNFRNYLKKYLENVQFEKDVPDKIRTLNNVLLRDRTFWTLWLVIRYGIITVRKRSWELCNVHEQVSKKWKLSESEISSIFGIADTKTNQHRAAVTMRRKCNDGIVAVAPLSSE